MVDYLYGGEVVIQADATANHYKFTGKERDPETGVDYFFARYYSSALGRFLTPDWSATPVPVPYASLVDPQSLNLYSYVQNNPITGTDPDGHLIDRLETAYSSADGVLTSSESNELVDSDYLASEHTFGSGPGEPAPAAPQTPQAPQAPQAQQKKDQPELVLTPDRKKELNVPGQGREQYVDYNIGSMDSNGKVTPLPKDNDHKVELKEKLLKGAVGVCDGSRNCTDVGYATDRMVVGPGKGHSVEKRFEIDGKAARIYDPASKKAYNFVRVDASLKKGFVFNYGNDPQ